jgi:hypothetical protein
LAFGIQEEWAEGPRYLNLSVPSAETGCIARLTEAAGNGNTRKKTVIPTNQKTTRKPDRYGRT